MVKHLYKALCSSQLSTNSQYWETINPILRLAQIAKAFTPLFRIPEFALQLFNLVYESFRKIYTL